MNESDSRVYNDWKNYELPDIIRDLKDALEKSGNIPIELFNEIIDVLIPAAYRLFAIGIGVKDTKDIPEEFRNIILEEIVSSFNEALPNDYPYLVAAIFSKSDPSLQIKIGCIKKSRIPGAHDIVSKKIFPIVAVKSELPPGKHFIKNLIIDDVSFLGKDILPELQ